MLAELGYQVIRQKGSHVRLKHDGPPVHLIPRRDAAFVTWLDSRPNALATGKPVEPFRLVRGRRHKLVRWESGKEALFVLQADPAEEKSLSDARLAGELGERLRTRMKETKDPAPSWLSK